VAQITTHAARSTGTAGLNAVVARLSMLDRQSEAAAGLGAFLVMSVGLSDGATTDARPLPMPSRSRALRHS
jgi:hypothetical protein